MTNGTPIIPLTTGEWAEPTTEFVGICRVSKFQTTDESKGKDGRTFTESRGLPRAARQWHVEVERFDAIYDLPDGQNAPVTVYMTIDLERFSDGTLSPVPRGDNKATFTVDKWSEAGMRLGVKPEVAEGVIAHYTLLRTKMFRGAAAKDILYPTKILPKDYKYEGDIRHFEVKGDQSLADVAAESETSVAAVPEVDVAALLVEAKLNPDDEAAVLAFVKAHPELPAETKVGVTTGELVDSLIEAGAIKRSDDGILTAV